MIWILFALLTVAAALAVLVPLSRGGRTAARGAEQDVAIYKDQLSELDRDLARGVIEAADAEAARTEIARRLLKASRQEASEEGAGKVPGSGRRKVAAVIATVAVPLGALALYLSAGSPQLADQPLAPRLAESGERPEIEIMVARVEKHLADNPQDGRGWSVVAPVYMRMGRSDDAASAYRNTIRLLGETSPLQTNLGEALVVSNGGVVTAQAWDAFKRAVELEPKAVKPRFFLAIALGQEGRRDDAIQAWQQLLGEAEGSEAWVPAARAELAGLGVTPPAMAENSQAESDVAPGPTRADMAAASEMSAGDRKEMISGMVARLSDRLDSDGGTIADWSRLIRAHLVLGDKPAARAALEKARAGLAADDAALAELDRLAIEAGLNS